MAGYFYFLNSHFVVPHGGCSIIGYYHLLSTASISCKQRFLYSSLREIYCATILLRNWMLFLEVKSYVNGDSCKCQVLSVCLIIGRWLGVFCFQFLCFGFVARCLYLEYKSGKIRKGFFHFLQVQCLLSWSFAIEDSSFFEIVVNYDIGTSQWRTFTE